ncbi:MAG: protein kinase, partial [bacterium]
MLGKKISHYNIIEKLGEGGMGVVYKAEDTKLKRHVAIKFLSQKLSTHGEELERFKLEAQAAATLNHPNIATIHEIDDVDGEYFIVMEMVAGQTLNELIEKGPPPLEQAIEIAVQVADGLQEAHEAKIVHRDIKPANIMLTKKGQVKIMDFGLAKMAQASLMTKAGTTLGTASYMSPEQARGEVVDHRTDIWSFGVLLYEMVSGQRPFQGDYEQAVIYSITNEEAPPVTGLRSGVPLELERILNKALAKNPDERYQHVDEMRVDLTALQKTDVSAVSKTVVGTTGEVAPTKSRFVIGAISVLALLILAVVVYFMRSDSGGGIVNIERKMLVVLPFENLGPPEDEYFADGLTEELTSRLAMVHGLGVISRTSAVQYKNSNKTSKQIGEELGVDYILEGTLRWDKSMEHVSRVRVTPQLIRTSDDTHVWAEQYDRVLDQLFEVQSEIAEQVVTQLDIKLMAPERRALWQKPTHNLEAYDYYLLGHKHRRRAGKFLDEDEYEMAVRMFEKAIEVDPNLAMAYVELVWIHSWVYFTGFDKTDERRALAKSAVDRAKEIQPDLPAIQEALAWYYYRCFRDYDRALHAFQKYQKMVPSSEPDLIANVTRRQGKWQQSVAAHEEAVVLNPRSAGRAFNLGASYTMLRNYQKADYWYDRALSLRPGYADPILYKYRNHLLWKGNAQDLRTSLRTIPRNNEVNYSLYFINLLESRFQEAVAHIDSLSDFLWRGPTLYLPKHLAYAQIYALMDEPTQMQVHADSARIFLEQAVQARPTDHRRHAALSLAYAFTGRKDEAIREGKRAVELFPVSKDALDGPDYVANLAWIYATGGEPEAAMEQLETLLSIPSEFSVPLLRIDPRWDGLRDKPRFQKL